MGSRGYHRLKKFKHFFAKIFYFFFHGHLQALQLVNHNQNIYAYETKAEAERINAHAAIELQDRKKACSLPDARNPLGLCLRVSVN